MAARQGKIEVVRILLNVLDGSSRPAANSALLFAAEMAGHKDLKLPVPPGFTITTEVCTYYYQHQGTLPSGLEDDVRAAMVRVGELMGARFGDRQNPLLVSVRSGARASMPGMMDTVLNLGLNDETVKVLARRSGDERFAYDCYRRFIQMYGDVVLGLKPQKKDDIDPFEEILSAKKREAGVEKDVELGLADLILTPWVMDAPHAARGLRAEGYSEHDQTSPGGIS
jgi:pyruvate,orthophosphate dikinase